MTVQKYPQKWTAVGNELIPYHLIDADANGNPRYVVHFTSLGIELADYGHIPGLKKYRAKWFGGGIVFQSYSLVDSIEEMRAMVKEFYSEQVAKSQAEMIKGAQENIRKEAPWILS